MKSKKFLAVLSAATMVASVAPAASVFASTSGTAVALTTPTVTASTTSVGTLKVVVPAGSATNGQSLTIVLPNSGAISTSTLPVSDLTGGSTNGVFVDTTDTVAGDTYISSATVSSSGDKVVLTFNHDIPLSSDFTFYVKLGNVNLSNASTGDYNAQLYASGNSGLPTGTVKLASVQSSGKAAVSVSNTETSSDSFSFDLNFVEPYAGVIASGDTVTLKLPSNYTWDSGITGGTTTSTYGDTFDYSVVSNSGNTLKLQIGTRHHVVGHTSDSDAYTTISGLSFSLNDGATPSAGDISAQISSSFSDTTSLVVGTYGDFGVTAKADSVKSLTAGFDNQSLDTLELAETLSGSLIDGRTVTLTLPDGVEWANQGDPVSVVNDVYLGNAAGSGLPVLSNSNRTLTYTVHGTSTSAATLDLKNLAIVTSPDFKGDVNVTVGGSAGVTGTVKVATVKPAVSASVDKQTDVKLGAANQQLGTITLTESAAGTIGGGDTSVDSYVYVDLPSGVEFSSTPKVTVTDGDLSIKNVQIDPSNSSRLEFQVAGQSVSKASTIQITNAQVTTDRVLPAEDLNVKVSGNAVQDTYPTNEWSTDAATVKVGRIVDANTHNLVKFVIGQNSYNVNGQDVTIDVAPYIKDSRTYLPVHFVANALGVADSNTVWNGADRTVTIFADGKVIQLKIGSKVMTVNGTPITMDVAPEIVNGRTMLPVSFVASALGYSATWDGTTQTVTIQ